MDYGSRVIEHEAAALREDDAAMHAATHESARLHTALAEMHRHEAAKMMSVRRTLKIAFDD